MKRNKLELTWVGKDERPRIEPRVLVEDLALDAGRSGKLPRSYILINESRIDGARTLDSIVTKHGYRS